MVDDYIPDKVLDKIKEKIVIGKIDDTKILVETDDKLPDDITLKYVMILVRCVIKDGHESYPQIILKEVLQVE